MVTFDHRDAGTAESRWRAAGIGDVPRSPRPEMDERARLLLVVAHPDDETLGATGLIRAVLAGGGHVDAVVCTAGEGSHPDSPTHTPAQLVELRERELTEAVASLAGDHPDRLQLHLLELPDGDLAGHADQVTARVRSLAGRAPASSPGTASPAPPLLATHYRRDGHTDHEVLGRALAALAAEWEAPLYEFPLWYWHWADPDTETAWRHFTRWPLSEADRTARAAALAAHASQVRPLSPAAGDEAILSPGVLEHFERDFDTYRYTGPENADASRATAIFDRLYRRTEDPWRYRTSSYERRKRALTLAALPQQHYGFLVEVGSSIGVLTEELAARSGAVLALEASSVAVELSRRRLDGLAHVRVEQAVLPGQWPGELMPGGTVDAVVLSEIGYFLQPDELTELIDACERSLGLAGQLVLCHWRGEVGGWPLDGDRVHRMVAADPRFRTVGEYREADFVLTVLARASAARRVAVVVPAHDEEEELPGCLASLAVACDRWEQLHGQGTVVVVVAVDRSSGGTVALAEAVAAQDPRIHVRTLGEATGQRPEGTVGHARDAGARWAVRLLTGEGSTTAAAHEAGSAPAPAPEEVWLASTDADTRVPADWLVAQTALAAQVDGDVVVTGTVDVARGGLEPDTARRWVSGYRHREGHEHVHGANLGLPWLTYLRVGGFPPVAVHEDVRLVEAARSAGIAVLATDRTRVQTSGRTQGRIPGGFAGFLRDLGLSGSS